MFGSGKRHHDALIHKGDRLVDIRAARPSSMKHEVHSADTLRSAAGEIGALALSKLMALQQDTSSSELVDLPRWIMATFLPFFHVFSKCWLELLVPSTGVNPAPSCIFLAQEPWHFQYYRLSRGGERRAAHHAKCRSGGQSEPMVGSTA